MISKSKKNLLLFVTFFFWFAMYVYVPFLSDYESINKPELLAFAGIILGSYGFTQMCFRIPIGIFSDRIGKRKSFIIFGTVIGGLSALGMFLFDTPIGLLIFRGLSGVSAACWVPISVLYSSYFDKNDVTKALGTASAVCFSGQVSGTLFGTILVRLIDSSKEIEVIIEKSPVPIEKYTFLAAAFGGLIGIILSLFIEEKPVERKNNSLKTIFINIISDKKAFLTLISVSLLAILGQILLFAGPYGFTPKYASEILFATPFQKGMITTASIISQVFAARIGSTIFVKKFGIKNACLTGFFLNTIYFIIMPFVGNMFVLYFIQIVFGFGYGLFFPLLMSLAVKDSSEDKRATFMGVFQSVYGLGMFVGPAIIGVLCSNFGLKTGFFMIAVLGVLAMILSGLFIKNVEK